jgi:elongation factor Ts
MEVTAKAVKELREATGVGILDCRKALQESGGDFEKAVDFLRQKGLAKAAKRSGRDASEGIIELYTHGGGRVGVMLELNCETDFVARNDSFKSLAHELALQVAAASPQYLTEDEIPEDVLARESAVAAKRAEEEGKPENIVPRIVEGRLKKFKQEVVFLNQPYIRDDSKNIEQLVQETVGTLGENIVIRRFARWELGESSQ